MKAKPATRGRQVTHNSPPQTSQSVSGMRQPGVFQRTLLRAFQLPQACREVFLLKQIQGYTLEETAAILGISIDTAWIRLRRARREIGHLENAEASECVR